MLAAYLAHARQDWTDLLAGVFIAVRAAYTAAYVADRPTLRSLLWAVGITGVVGLFCIGAA